MIAPAVPPGPVPRGEIAALTGLRAVAALWVFAFHLELRAPLMPGGPAAALAGAGAIGMTLFFVLSGYVLVLASRDGLVARAFWRARAARIYPLYALAALCALPWLMLHAGAAPELAAIAVIGAAMLQAWIPGLFGVWNHAASWSLSVEAAFYAAFPWLRRMVMPLGPAGLAGLAALACMASAALAATSLLPGAPGFAFHYANPLMRLPEFVVGMAFGGMALRGVRVPGAVAGMAVAGFVLVLAATGAPGLPTFWAAPGALVAGLVLIHLTHARGGLLASRPMRWGGRVSYAFYLFQFHVILGLPHLLPLPAPAFWAAAFALTLAVAAAAHHLVERPARAALRRGPVPRGAVA